MALALTIAGVDRISSLRWGTLKLKVTADGAQGILDCQLVNFKPNDDDTVVLTDGATTYYDGNVRSIDIQEFKSGTYFTTISCQDDATLPGVPGTAAFNLSDTPNFTTTFPYKDLSYKQLSARGSSYSSLETSGTISTYQPGLLVNTNIQITSANAGLSATTFHIKEIATQWENDTTPLFTLSFGDSPVRLVDTIISQITGEALDTSSDLAQALVGHTHVVADVASLPTLPDALYPVGDLAYVIENGKIYRNHDDVWTAQVDGADILVSSITAGAISAGAIGTEALAATIVIASLMKTADSGNRVEFDNLGIRCFDSSDNLLVTIPTDGESPVYVNGQIEATNLLVTGDTTLRGSDNTLDAEAVLTVDSYQLPPSQPPVLTQWWFTTTLNTGSQILGRYTDVAGSACYYDAAGGASGATACYVFLVRSPSSGTSYSIKEYNASTGALERETALPAGNYQSITRLGGDWYITEHGDFAYIKVKKFNRALGTLQLTSADLESTQYGNSTCITHDGTSLYVVYNNFDTNHSVASAAFKRKVLNTSLTVTDTDNISLPATPSGKTHVRCMGAVIESSKLYLTLCWTSSSSPTASPLVNTYAYSTLATPALVANEDWPGPVVNNTVGSATGNLIHDGTFFNQVVLNGSSTTVTRYTNWTWTTESPVYWVAYSWYDSVATTHETTVGPMASITMSKRKRLTITNAPIPGSGGADEPDVRRLYITRNATQPATTALDLQSTSSATTTILTNWTAGGAAPPTTNGFESVARPATIQSAVAPASGGWALHGDGLIERDHQTYTVTVSGGGTATFTSRGWYMQVGEVVFLHIDITVTAVGSGASLVTFNLPVTSISGTNQAISGYVSGLAGETGPCMAAIGSAASSTNALVLLDGTNLIGSDLDSTNGRIRLNGWYYAG